MYNEIVLLHVVGAFLFALAHGTSMLVAFRVRQADEPSRVTELLGLSLLATRLMYVGLLLLIVGGVWATFAGDLWGEPWVWLSVGLLVVIIVAMYALATPFYGRMRAAAEAATGSGPVPPAGAVTSDPAASVADLERLTSSRRPEILALVGGLGFVVILWLMVVKPF